MDISSFLFAAISIPLLILVIFDGFVSNDKLMASISVGILTLVAISALFWVVYVIAMMS